MIFLITGTSGFSLRTVAARSLVVGFFFPMLLYAEYTVPTDPPITPCK